MEKTLFDEDNYSDLLNYSWKVIWLNQEVRKKLGFFTLFRALALFSCVHQTTDFKAAYADSSSIYW